MTNAPAPSVVVEGIGYDLLTVRRNGGAVYLAARTRDRILRIGERDATLEEVRVHGRLERLGFPVPTKLSEGDHADRYYMVESYLGDNHFSALFSKDVATFGQVTSEGFGHFVDVTERLVRAQLVSVRSDGVRKDDLFRAVHVPTVLSERPDLAERIGRAADRHFIRIESFPTVLTHFDYNPRNCYPEGVIDLETVHPAPLGYDAVSGVSSVDWFPAGPHFEMTRSYVFPPELVRYYYERLDAVFREEGLPPVSEFRRDFEFFRGIWACARMGDMPKIQKFRFDRLEREFLSE